MGRQRRTVRPRSGKAKLFIWGAVIAGVGYALWTSATFKSLVQGIAPSLFPSGTAPIPSALQASNTPTPSAYDGGGGGSTYAPAGGATDTTLSPDDLAQYSTGATAIDYGGTDGSDDASAETENPTIDYPAA